MAKVFTRPAGLVAQVGRFGLASNEAPAVVPKEVAGELAGDERFRIEGEVPEPAPPTEQLPKKRARRAQEE